MPFLLPDNFASPLQRDGIVIESTSFSLQHYKPTLYRELGVALPEKVQSAVPKRQAEFLAGRYCAANVLRAVGNKSTVVVSGENRVPQWPQGSVGSISHTAGRAVAVASLAKHCIGLGIDCETLIRPDVAERIFDTIAVASEELLLQQLGWSKPWFLTCIFSAKESLFKALYPTVQKYFGFDSAEVVRIENGQYSIVLTRDLNEQWRAGQRFDGMYLMDDKTPDKEFVLTLLEVLQ